MADDNSRGLRGPKAETVEQIAFHITEVYKPKEGPILLMWRETVNGFYLKLNDQYPVWRRDDSHVHLHFKRFGPGVCRTLSHGGLTIVRVNALIREHVKHGEPPDRTRKRTDEWYRSCLPSASHMTFGIVCFPRDAQQDHPLVEFSRAKRLKETVTGVTNALDGARTANDLGNLSDEVTDRMVGENKTRLVGAFNDDHYPLFRDRNGLRDEPPPPIAPPA